MDKTYSMSIDALEQKLGIDLFVNLPDQVGKSVADQIEAEDPVPLPQKPLGNGLADTAAAAADHDTHTSSPLL